MYDGRAGPSFLAAPPVAAETNQIDESGTVTVYSLQVMGSST